MSAVTSEFRDDGIRVVTMAHPPVNALTVQGWFDVAAALDAARDDLTVKVVILRAEGKGYNAGVDIKEMQNTEGFDALIGANKGCFAAFKAVYECAVPVIAAVNGFCVGGGVGLVGNADIVVASEDAYFGVPEVKQGALGAATHMARLVPQHLMRTLYFTARTITAADLVRHGSVYAVVPRDRARRHRPRGSPAEIADKDARSSAPPRRRSTASTRSTSTSSYRFEQGFTMELNLAGVIRGAPRRLRRHRRSAKESDASPARRSMTDRRGRRPARRRHDDRHRRLGSAPQADGAGPRDPALRPQGPAPRALAVPTSACSPAPARSASLAYAFVSLDSIPLEPLFSKARL